MVTSTMILIGGAGLGLALTYRHREQGWMAVADYAIPVFILGAGAAALWLLVVGA